MKARLIQCVEGEWMNTEVDAENIRAAFEVRGFTFTGINTSTRCRPELRGLPMFSELAGPCYGGEEFPVRYEDAKTYEHCST